MRKPRHSSLTATKKPKAPEAAKQKVADRVRLFLLEKKISRKELAHDIGRQKHTVDNFFRGIFTESTLALIEKILGRSFRSTSQISPLEWGGYNAESVAKLLGSYLTLRFDFEKSDHIVAHVTTFEWASTENAQIQNGQLSQKPMVEGFGVVFREERRADPQYTHRGQVWIPPDSNFMYLVTAYGDARLRAAIVSKPILGDMKMRGILLSLYHPGGPAYIPATSPILFMRLGDPIANGEVGSIGVTHSCYRKYRQELDSIRASSHAIFALPELPRIIRR
jgi:hypothetical protein